MGSGGGVACEYGQGYCMRLAMKVGKIQIKVVTVVQQSRLNGGSDSVARQRRL